MHPSCKCLLVCSSNPLLPDFTVTSPSTMSDIPPSPSPTVASNMSSGDQQDPPAPLSRAPGARASRRVGTVQGKLRNASASRTNKKGGHTARRTAAEKGKQRVDPPREDDQLRATTMSPLDIVIEDHLNRQRPGTPIVGSTIDSNAKPKTPTNLITAVFRYLSSSQSSQSGDPTHDQLPQVSERPLLEDFFETDKWAREFLKTKFELERFDYDDRVVTDSPTSSTAVMTQYKPPKPESDVTSKEASDSRTFSDTKDIRPGDTCYACGQVQPVVTSSSNAEKISPADQAQGAGSFVPTEYDLSTISSLMHQEKKSAQDTAPSTSSVTVQHKKKGRPRKIKTSEEQAGTTATTSANQGEKSPPVVDGPTPVPIGSTSTMSTRRHRFIPWSLPVSPSPVESCQQHNATTSDLHPQSQLLPNSEHTVPFSHRRNPPEPASTTDGHQQSTAPRPPLAASDTGPRRSKRQTNKANQQG